MRPRVALRQPSHLVGRFDFLVTTGDGGPVAGMGNVGSFAPFLLNQGFGSYGPVVLGYLIAVATSMGIDFASGSAYEHQPDGVHLVLKPSPPKPD